MSSKPWHFVFFIFNSYSHTHSNLKRASSIPKLFFFSHFFFLIHSFATIPPQYFTLFTFTSSKPCHFFFFYMRFFFQARVRFPSFFLFFHSFVHTYFTITYTRHMLLKHGFDSQVFFLHIFYFTCSLLQLFFLHLKFFLLHVFFSLHTLLYYYYFFLFFSIIHTNKFLTLKQNANKIYLH